MPELPAAREELQVREAALETLRNHLSEVLVQRERRRHLEGRQVRLAAVEVNAATLGDRHRTTDGVREFREDRRHLVCALEIELLAAVAQPVGIVDGLARSNAQQDVVRRASLRWR